MMFLHLDGLVHDWTKATAKEFMYDVNMHMQSVWWDRRRNKQL